MSVKKKCRCVAEGNRKYPMSAKLSLSLLRGGALHSAFTVCLPCVVSFNYSILILAYSLVIQLISEAGAASDFFLLFFFLHFFFLSPTLETFEPALLRTYDAFVPVEDTMEAKMHMKEWLVAQIDSGRYEGLCWEDEGKTMFRIPWKHAAKKDYKQTEDAALFKAWAVYKGKHREGRDKADPTMWKTRLRCALNKSTDFQEVPERNQLDITEPYKVYLIQQDNGPARPAESSKTRDQVISPAKRSPRSPAFLDKQLHSQKDSFYGRKEEVKPLTDDLMMEHMYCEFTGKKPLNQNPAPVTFLSPTMTISDLRMQVILLYHGQTVMKVTTRSPDGCFILQGRVPVGNERIYGPCNAQQLSFPPPRCIALPEGMTEAMNRLLCHLERGVLLWVAPDGVFIKRFCQGRVYWSGPAAQHADRPNKLEREKTFKLLDVPTFLNELQCCLQGKGSPPCNEIELCFGEEYPDPNVPKTRKLIMAKVVPLFAVELLQRFNLGEKEEKWPVLTSNTAGEKI